MTKIIQFPGSYSPEPAKNEDIKGKKTVFDYDRGIDTEIEDTFTPSLTDEQEGAIRKIAGYSLEDMIALVGEERMEELFSNLTSKNSPVTISPVVSAKPFKEGLKEIWDDSDKARADRLHKKTDLYRTLRAFEKFEEECSEKHNELYGTNTEIKVAFTNEDGDKYYLTDELIKQIDFYKKSKVGQTFSLIGQKISGGINNFIDSMRLNDD